jgi:UPF0176 protein
MPTCIAAYKFVDIEDPSALAASLRSWAQAAGLLGTALVAGEGVNLFLAGAEPGITSFLARLRGDPRFADIAARSSHSNAAPFRRLKVKVKPEIIAFRRLRASRQRAPSVAPADLARWIAQGSDDDGRRLVLLDTRNREEVGHGSFAGALTLPIDSFTDLPDALGAHRDALADAAVVGFCTGGIRCEKAVAWMRDAGMDNACQLDGGILGYFEAVGGFGYQGHCFVFDARIAVDAALRPLAESGAGTERAAA